MPQVLSGSAVYTPFSVIAIPALRREDPSIATAVMVEINRRAERGTFIVLFGAIVLASVALGVSALTRGSITEGSIAMTASAAVAIALASAAR